MAGGPSVTVNNDARDRQFRRLRWFGPERRDRGPRRGRHAPGDWSSNAVAPHAAPAGPRRPGACSTRPQRAHGRRRRAGISPCHGFSSAPPRLPTAGRIPILRGLPFKASSPARPVSRRRRGLLGDSCLGRIARWWRVAPGRRGGAAFSARMVRVPRLAEVTVPTRPSWCSGRPPGDHLSRRSDPSILQSVTG